VKSIIKSSLLVYGIWLYASASIAGEIAIYHGKHADALLLTFGDRKVLKLAGGAPPRGQATSEDCFVEADISLRKLPAYYEGNLLPVQNELMTMNERDVTGKKIGAYILKNKIRVGGVIHQEFARILRISRATMRN